RETEITGPVAARLFVSSTTTDADLFCVLRLLRPGGREVTFPGAIDPNTPVAQGWLRLSHRKLDPELSTPYRPYHSHDEIQPLAPPPGEIARAVGGIGPTGGAAPPGSGGALPTRGRDYGARRPGAPRLGTFKNEMPGCGPFLHDDPVDRPPHLIASTQSLWHG